MGQRYAWVHVAVTPCVRVCVRVKKPDQADCGRCGAVRRVGGLALVYSHPASVYPAGSLPLQDRWSHPSVYWVSAVRGHSSSHLTTLMPHNLLQPRAVCGEGLLLLCSNTLFGVSHVCNYPYLQRKTKGQTKSRCKVQGRKGGSMWQCRGPARKMLVYILWNKVEVSDITVQNKYPMKMMRDEQHGDDP
ncbi:hypothetical protein CFC21_037400 [Triticum aestivum]|uniref:Uncharacterized protein n=2 Tax=Triticum aestivum TaxID=4565 RepID=A0A3B6ES05_WHEAT|nr:hypothetical protein CFC21_037400 [Triticum aestivum]